MFAIIIILTLGSIIFISTLVITDVPTHDNSSGKNAEKKYDYQDRDKYGYDEKDVKSSGYNREVHDRTGAAFLNGYDPLGDGGRGSFWNHCTIG